MALNPAVARLFTLVILEHTARSTPPDLPRDVRGRVSGARADSRRWLWAPHDALCKPRTIGGVLGSDIGSEGLQCFTPNAESVWG